MAPPPPPLPTAPPPACEPRGRRPSALPGPRGRPPSPGRDRDARGGGCSWTHTPRARAPPTAFSRRGRDRRASPHQRARATHGHRPGAAREDEPEQYGSRAPHGQSIANEARSIALPGRAEGRIGSVRASGGAVRGPLLRPPPPGRPHGAAPRPRPKAQAGREYADDKIGAG